MPTVTLADYIDAVHRDEQPRPVLSVLDALKGLAIAVENFRRQSSRAEVDPYARESARSTLVLLETALADAKHAARSEERRAHHVDQRLS
jgi:hypothetical protein